MNVPDRLVVIPTLIASGAVTVTIPEDIGDTSKFAEKLIVPAIPIVDPSCSTTTPETGVSGSTTYRVKREVA